MYSFAAQMRCSTTVRSGPPPRRDRRDRDRRRLFGPDQFGRPSCFRVAASSRHVSPQPASRSLMWSSARFRRSANVFGLSSVDIQKSLKTCRTIWRRRSISCLLGEVSDVMPIRWLSGRTATLSATGSSSAMVSTVSLAAFGSELPFHGPASSLMNSTMILVQPDIVTLRPHRKLDLFVCGDQSGRNTRGRADVVARRLHVKRPHVHYDADSLSRATSNVWG